MESPNRTEHSCHPQHDSTRAVSVIREVARTARLERLPVTIDRIRNARKPSRQFHETIATRAASSDPVATRARDAIRGIREVSLSSWFARRINDAYRREYETKHRAQMVALAEGARSSGLPVPVLSACGRGTAEIRFTQLLRYFLDPRQPHGLSHRLLDAAFGEMIFERRAYDEDFWQHAEVRAEVDLGFTRRPDGRLHSNHLDLLVTTSDVAVLIEQKILSSENTASVGPAEEGQLEREQVRQLAEYSEAFETSRARLAPNARHVFKMYLTPRGRTSLHSPDWIPLSHMDLILRFLALDVQQVSPVARHNLVAFLWDLACGPLELADELHGMLPDLERAIGSADRGCMGPYLNWRHRGGGSLSLLMEVLQLLQEGS